MLTLLTKLELDDFRLRIMNSELIDKFALGYIKEIQKMKSLRKLELELDRNRITFKSAKAISFGLKK